MGEEKYGVAILERAVLASGEVLRVVYEVFVEKKGIWHLFGLQSVIQKLVGLDLQKVKLELSDLSEVERESLTASFKATLPAALQAKMGTGLDLVEEAIDLGEDAVAMVTKFIADGQAFIAKAKALVGA